MRLRWTWLGFGFAVVLAACAGGSAYPLLTPAGASQWSSTALGTPVRGVVLHLQPHPGDSVELVSAEAVGVAAGADVSIYYAPPVFGANGGMTIGDDLRPLAGAMVTVSPTASDGPANDVGIVAVITPRAAGRYTVTAIRLTFRLNGGEPQTKEGITQYLTVCADDPAPAECDQTPPP